MQHQKQNWLRYLFSALFCLFLYLVMTLLSLPPLSPVFLVCASCVVGDGTSYRLRLLTAVAKCRLSRAEEPLGVAILLAWLLSFFINLLFLYNDASTSYESVCVQCGFQRSLVFLEGYYSPQLLRSHTQPAYTCSLVGTYLGMQAAKAHFYLLGRQWLQT